MVDMEAEKKEIGRTLGEIAAAENRRDVEKILELVTEDAIFQKPNTSQIQGREAWREDYEKVFATLVSSEIRTLHIEVSSSGDMAWEYGYYISTYKKPGALSRPKESILAFGRKSLANGKAPLLASVEMTQQARFLPLLS